MDNDKLKLIARRLVNKHAAKELQAGFKPTGLHRYDDEAGNLIYFRARLKHQDGNKWIRPFHLDPTINDWVMREPEFFDKKPLYRLPNLVNNLQSEVWVVEGEQKVDELEKLGVIATTSGSSTSASDANWNLLRERNIVIWRDNDESGINYLDDVANILQSLNCNVCLIDVDKLNLPQKGDVVDWLKRNPNATHDDILALPVVKVVISPSKPNENITADYKGEVIELAKLSDIAYQHQRRETAKHLKITVATLDKLVKQARKETESNSSTLFPNIEPWYESVNGESLFDELENLINRIMAFPSAHEVKAVVLYILHTHLIDSANCSPILFISSPEKRCGKSTLLSVLQRLVKRPLVASNITPAALYRSIEKWTPTFILDEADTFMRDNEEIRGVINSGHSRDMAYVIRCVGDNHDPKPFNTWCPKIIAGIGHLPDTNEDRSIIICLRRKLDNEIKDTKNDIPKGKFEELLQKCVRFAEDNIEHMETINPMVPDTLNDRAADNWIPLLSIAELISEKCRQAAADAAIHLCDAKYEPISVGVELLQDIRTIFVEKRLEHIGTSELLEALCSDAEAPWITYNRGKPLSARQLANRIKDFGIKSKDIRFPSYNKTLKGYSQSDFSEAFSRYLPPYCSDKDIPSATARQSTASTGYKESHMRDKQNFSWQEEIRKPSPQKDCRAIADKTPNSGTTIEKEMMRAEL